VQQRTGRVRNPFGAGLAIVHDPLLEAEAARMSHRIGSPAPPATSLPAPRAPAPPAPRAVQRLPAIQGNSPHGAVGNHGVAQPTLRAALWNTVSYGVSGAVVGALAVVAGPAAVAATVTTGVLAGSVGALGAVVGFYRGWQVLTPEQRQKQDLLASYVAFADGLENAPLHPEDARNAKYRDDILVQVRLRVKKLESASEIDIDEIDGYAQIAKLSVERLKRAVESFVPPVKERAKYTPATGNVPSRTWDVVDHSLAMLVKASASRYTTATPSTSTSSKPTSKSASSSSTRILSASQIAAQADYLIRDIEKKRFTGNQSVYPSESGITIADKVKIAKSLLDRYHNAVQAAWAGSNVYYFIVWTPGGKIDITGHKFKNNVDVSWGKSNVFNYHVEW
jgi:hypothetical protein